MPLIKSATYTSVRAALEGCIQDIIDICGYPNFENSDIPNFLHRLINEQILDTELQNYIGLQDHASYKLLMSFWHYDAVAQEALENTYGKSDQITTQVCVLQNILDEINGLEATTQDIDVNHLPKLKGEQRLSELKRMEAVETNPLLKQKLRLESVLQQNELPIQVRFQQFKTVYEQTYKAAFFKNPWSTMKGKLERNEFTTLEEIRAYAQQHPKTRSAKILSRLEATWTQQDQQNKGQDNAPTF